MMKKTVTILLSFILVMCLIACGNSAGRSEHPSVENSSIENGTGNNAENSTGDQAQTESGATWVEGHRLNGSDSQETVMEWVNSLGLNLGE